MDRAFLRSSIRPVNGKKQVVSLVDLFSGCGGMTVGMVEAARRLDRDIDLRLAVDSDERVLSILLKNLSVRSAEGHDISKSFPGNLGEPLALMEMEVKRKVGDVDIVLGGPPCQGHSDLNNHTRRNDPKNALYARMARAAEVLEPKVVIIENVPPVQWDESGVVRTTSTALGNAGYFVAEKVIDLRKLGVPQSRRRHFLLASKLASLDPTKTLETVATGLENHEARTVRWAIDDLLQVSADTEFDTPSKRSDENAERMRYLFEHNTYDLPDSERPKCHRTKEHTYSSVYGRLRWDEPAQTITTGFGSMGQGRYVHPQRRRTLTPHEAARLQTFPDWFDFKSQESRVVLATAIGNAVPPLAIAQLGLAILPHLA